MGDCSVKSCTVIVAAGDFPRRGGEAWRLLESAKRVICCDGAADIYKRRFRRDPDVVIGDGDSVRGDFPCRVIVDEQETNDLEKAMRYCRANGWTDMVIVGACGKREDHAIGNVFRALAYGVELVSNDGRFVPVIGHRTFRVTKGAAVSVFAPNPRTRVKSSGLVWPLDTVRFDNLYCATLNRAARTRVTLDASYPISVYLPS